MIPLYLPKEIVPMRISRAGTSQERTNRSIRFSLFMLAAATTAVLLAAGACRSGSSAARTGLVPAGLRCESLADPLGIDAPRPRLSWRLESADPDARGLVQKAYRILAASTPEALAQERADLWDSGRVESGETSGVPYGGAALGSRTACFWKVRVFDGGDRPSPWSPVARFETGLLEPGDWRASWIAARDRSAVPPKGRPGFRSLPAGSAASAKWVQVDLGACREIDAVRLYPAWPEGWAPGYGFPVRFRVECSDDPRFEHATRLVDCSDADYPLPDDRPQAFTGLKGSGRYVRLTATRLWKTKNRKEYVLALDELEVVAGGLNAARNAAVTAGDSSEAEAWGAAGLTDGRRAAADAFPEGVSPAVMLRREFAVDGPVRRARAYVCGLGYHELHVNGAVIGDHALDPAFTDYGKRALYVTYDITAALRTGTNAVGVLLGAGLYDMSTPDAWDFFTAPWRASPRLLARIDIDLADGSRRTIVSDGTWRASTAGPVVYNNLRSGETYDARRERPGWDVPACDDSGWAPAVEVAGPRGRLAAQALPPIRATETFVPVSVTEARPGVWVFDLGRNISGRPRLSITGRRGQTIQMRCNEQLNPDTGSGSDRTLVSGKPPAGNDPAEPDGTVSTSLSQFTWGRFQTDQYVLKGTGVEVWEPRFCYHGFRFVEVTGLEGPPSADMIRGIALHTDVHPAGEFSCSNDLVNLIQAAVVRTQKNALHGYPEDCAQREKCGWTADAMMSAEQAMMNFDMAAFYDKWLADLRDSQAADGNIPVIVPTTGWGSGGIEPCWSGVCALLPWFVYAQYGDPRILADNYDMMKRYSDFLASRAKANIIEGSSLGDWLEVGYTFSARTPMALTSTALHFAIADAVARAADVLGRAGDARRYAALAAAVRASFNAKFFDASRKSYGGDSQTANALPLQLGLVPEELRTAVFANLVDNVVAVRKGHISTGFMGIKPVLAMLTGLGRHDLALAMVTKETYPGWGHMIRSGSTTLWEAWEGIDSLSHPATSSVGAWFYHVVAGIAPDPAGPGFKKMIMKPYPRGLSSARAVYESVRGPIRSDWKRSGADFLWDIGVPPNTAATVFVPARDAASVTEGGRPAAEAPGVSFLRLEAGRAVYAVGSGNYSFRSAGAPE